MALSFSPFGGMILSGPSGPSTKTHLCELRWCVWHSAAGNVCLAGCLRGRDQSLMCC